MRHGHLLAAAALLAASASVHAEHFQYAVSLAGTYSEGGTDGCTPPNFDQSACPRAGSLSAMLSFDTPSSADGSYSIEEGFGDVTNLVVTLGWLPTDSLLGGVNLNNGVPNGTVQASDQTETFMFDWGNRSASYSYDYGYHEANGIFTGSLSAVPESATAMLLLAGLFGLLGLRQKVGALGRTWATVRATLTQHICKINR